MKVRASIGSSFDPHRNSLNTLRLIFAAGVIVGHSWPIGGLGHPPHYGNFDPGAFSVAAFFVASGFLITASRERTGFFRYMWSRALRIYPAFWACLLLTSFLFAPLAALANNGWNLASATSYSITNATLQIRQWGIGDTLASAPIPNAWNGSLWTLYWEFGCYVIIGVFYCVRIFRGPYWTVGLFLGFTALAIHHRLNEIGEIAFPSYPKYLIPFFLAGAVINRFRNRLPANPILFGLCLAIIIGSMIIRWDFIIAPLPLAYCVIWLGCFTPRIAERIGDGSVDISYGMYIYAYPIQQLLVIVNANKLGISFMICASVLTTVIPAALSWFFVEKPCMRFKKATFRLPVMLSRRQRRAVSPPNAPPTQKSQ